MTLKIRLPDVSLRLLTAAIGPRLLVGRQLLKVSPRVSQFALATAGLRDEAGGPTYGVDACK